ncbi:MAG TPA: AzlC family ABC transporter permease [Amaricoccus sp.]|nr:AzlC family ABC transporter permease [Amaricoccus sp.]
MRDPSIHRAYWEGARDSLPFLIVVIPFGMIFGVLASEAGWTLAQILGMSVLVVAGASQFTALQLIGEQAPLLIVIATSLAVNLRMAMYSASIAPHLGATPPLRRAAAAYFLTDQSYGVAISRYARHPVLATPAARLAYFFGCALPVCGPWYVATWAGAVAGAAIPEALALDFAVPVTFIALVAPGLRTLPNLAAALVSAAVALALYRLPYSLGLLVAAGAAMAAGALAEIWRDRR